MKKLSKYMFYIKYLIQSNHIKFIDSFISIYLNQIINEINKNYKQDENIFINYSSLDDPNKSLERKIILLIMLLNFCKRIINLNSYTKLTNYVTFNKLSNLKLIYHEDLSYCLIILSFQNRKIIVNINDKLSSSNFLEIIINNEYTINNKLINNLILEYFSLSSNIQVLNLINELGKRSLDNFNIEPPFSTIS